MNNTRLSLEESYKILGLPYNSTKSEVEATYKKLLIKYHPDNYVSKSEYEKRIAAQKLSEINDAKNIILNYRGSFQSYSTNYSSSTGSTTKSEYEKDFYEKMRKMTEEMEEMQKKEEEELEKFKAKIIKTIFSVMMWSLVISTGGHVIKSIFIDKDDKDRDNKKITEDNSLSLTKIHTLKKTDSIEELAIEANCKEEDILSLNENIEVGSSIKIPYNVREDDLEYFTETIDFNNKKLEEIAQDYNTDIKTLLKLNPDSIVELGNAYFIIGDKLEVPNFISSEKLKTQKASTKQKIYKK